MSLKLIAAIAATLTLAACGTPMKYQTQLPVGVQGAPSVLARSPLIDQTNHMTQHLDQDKNILYFQNFGGGGAAVGILLGPFGVAANMKMIESRTNEDVAALRGKIDIKPRAVFADVAAKQGLSIADTGAGARLTPYLYVSKAEDDKLLVSATVIVEQQGPAEKWVGKYLVQMPKTYSVKELAALDANGITQFQASLAASFGKIVAHMQAESPAGLALEQPVLFHSNLLAPRMDFEMQGNLIADSDGLVWIRTFGGVYAIRKDNVQYVVKKG